MTKVDEYDTNVGGDGLDKVFLSARLFRLRTALSLSTGVSEKDIFLMKNYSIDPITSYKVCCPVLIHIQYSVFYEIRERMQERSAFEEVNC